MRTAGWAVAIVALAAVLARGQAPPRQGEINASDYLATIVRSLGQAHEGIAAVNAAATGTTLTEKMTAAKDAIAEVNLAIVRLGDLAAVKSENAKSAAQGIVGAYLMILKSLGMQRSAYERLDAASRMEDLAGLRSSASDAASLYHQSTRLLYDAVGLAFLSTMMPDPAAPETKTVVNMSAAEKAALLELIESEFGLEVRNVNSTQTGPMQAAGLLYSGLLKQRTRPN